MLFINACLRSQDPQIMFIHNIQQRIPRSTFRQFPFCRLSPFYCFLMGTDGELVIKTSLDRASLPVSFRCKRGTRRTAIISIHPCEVSRGICRITLANSCKSRAIPMPLFPRSHESLSGLGFVEQFLMPTGCLAKFFMPLVCPINAARSDQPKRKGWAGTSGKGLLAHPWSHPMCPSFLAAQPSIARIIN